MKQQKKVLYRFGDFFLNIIKAETILNTVLKTWFKFNVYMDSFDIHQEIGIRINQEFC